MPPRPRRPDAGFTFLEALVSLALLALALLLGVDAFLQQTRVVQRMESERQAFRALESTMEAVRAGVLPLASTWLEGFTTAVGTPAPRDLRIWMQVDASPTHGLYDVHLQATYKVAGFGQVKNLHSKVYRP
jgi:type II secretory pathway pseudopilin PulG